MIRRWLRFNAVGLGGIVVQLAVLQALHLAGLHYLPATALAVMAAVLHNFFWHRRYTWAERTGHLPRYLLTTGLLSVAGNVGGMKAVMTWLAWPVLPANLLVIGAMHVFNFLVAEHYVFRLR